jgi:hypothetical protein
MISPACGRCHIANYSAEAEILSSDVDCPYSIPVESETAFAGVLPATWFVPMFRDRTILAGVGLILKSYLHSLSLRFVGNVPSRLPTQPLMDLLVSFFPVVQSLPNIAHVTNYHGLNTILAEG